MDAADVTAGTVGEESIAADLKNIEKPVPNNKQIINRSWLAIIFSFRLHTAPHVTGYERF
jgi:hypothetical protein